MCILLSILGFLRVVYFGFNCVFGSWLQSAVANSFACPGVQHTAPSSGPKLSRLGVMLGYPTAIPSLAPQIWGCPSIIFSFTEHNVLNNAWWTKNQSVYEQTNLFIWFSVYVIYIQPNIWQYLNVAWISMLARAPDLVPHNLVWLGTQVSLPLKLLAACFPTPQLLQLDRVCTLESPVSMGFPNFFWRILFEHHFLNGVLQPAIWPILFGHYWNNK